MFVIIVSLPFLIVDVLILCISSSSSSCSIESLLVAPPIDETLSLILTWDIIELVLVESSVTNDIFLDWLSNKNFSCWFNDNIDCENGTLNITLSSIKSSASSIMGEFLCCCCSDKTAGGGGGDGFCLYLNILVWSDLYWEILLLMLDLRKLNRCEGVKLLGVRLIFIMYCEGGVFGTSCCCCCCCSCNTIIGDCCWSCCCKIVFIDPLLRIDDDRVSCKGDGQ